MRSHKAVGLGHRHVQGNHVAVVRRSVGVRLPQAEAVRAHGQILDAKAVGLGLLGGARA